MNDRLHEMIMTRRPDIVTEGVCCTGWGVDDGICMAKIIVVINRSVSEISRFEAVNTRSVLTSTSRELNHKISFLG